MVIIVHHLENSRSQRILWLLEEAGLPYLVRHYQRDKQTMLAPAQLRWVHPLGKAPAVEVDGRILVESGAIVEYLVEAGGSRLKPAEPEEKLRYRHFLHYAEGSLMPPLLAMLVIKRLGLLGRPARPTIQRFIDQQLTWLESELVERPWFAGNQFSAADIMMAFPLETARERGGLNENLVYLSRWLERVQARPAYLAALHRGGAYRHGLKPRLK